MIGIKSIASYVPADGIDNYAQGAKFAKDEEFIIGKIGSAFLPRKEAAQETSDLCVEAVNALFANNPDLKRESIDALIDRKSTRLNSSHVRKSRMPSSA